MSSYAIEPGRRHGRHAMPHPDWKGIVSRYLILKRRGAAGPLRNAGSAGHHSPVQETPLCEPVGTHGGASKQGLSS